MLYTVRRIMHLGLTDDIEGAVKIMKNMLVSLDKEHYSLTTLVRDITEIVPLADKLKLEGDNHLAFTAILSDVKQCAMMGYQTHNLL